MLRNLHINEMPKEGVQCLPLQASSVTVKDILVTRVRARLGVLPERSETKRWWIRLYSDEKSNNIPPASRKRADGGRKVSDPQRVGRCESTVVTRTGLPPVSGGIDDLCWD
jgi:hypothetical protein